MRIRIQPPAECDRGPRGIEALFDALHEANPQQRPLSLEIGPHDGGIALFADVPPELKATFLEELQDAYPGISIEILPPRIASDANCASACLILTPDVFPIRLYGAFDELKERTRHDPLLGILSQLRPTGSVSAGIRLTLQPATTKRLKRASRADQNLQRSFRSDRVRRLHYAYCSSPRRSERMIAWLCRRFATKRRNSPASENCKRR